MPTARPIPSTPGPQEASTTNEARQSNDVQDAELARLARSGNGAAFDTLYRRHASAVGRRLRFLVGAQQDVEDVLQMTFLEMHRALPRYDDTRPFAPWLHGIAVRVASTFLRTKRRRWWQSAKADVEVVAMDATAAADERAENVQAARRVWQEVEKLPVEKRVAFTLFELEQCTVGEIAELTGVSAQTAWARVNSAREVIAKRMAKVRGGP